MFKRLQSFLLLLAMLGLWAAQPAAASHLQGGDLTYASLGNNRYRVTLHLYRDCSGITPSQFTLECRSGGCSTAATVSAPMTQVGGTTVGRQYCATISGLCTAGGPANSETYTYVAEVTLAPAQRWVLSTFQNARPTTANLDAGASSGDLYFEATLNNLVPLAGTTGTVITNNSPVASAQPVAFIPVNRMSNVSNSAFDVDGDSLVYSLETPLASCNVPANYAPYPNASGGMTPISTNPLCVLQAPQITTYTATLPILVAYDTLGSCPIKTAVPRFRFDASTGSITLEPSRYLNTPSSQGENKYAAVVKITEFRRLNGRFVEIGSMRRELYFIVYDCGTNVIPRLTPSVTVQRGLGTGAQSVVQPFGQYISVVAGEPVSVLVNATDANPAQTLTLNLDYNAMPGAVLQNLGGGQARLTFTPAATTPSGLYRIAVTAEDNACPIKGLETKILTFRVTGTALATHAQAALVVAAYPNPFTEQVQFQLATAGVQTLTVCDRLGRTVATVRSQPNGTVVWQPATNLAPGLYLARTADGTQTIRLLRNAAQ